MHFTVNNVNLDFCLDNIGLSQQEKQDWIERIRDDFNERIDNNKIVKLLLSLPRGQLQTLADTGTTVAGDYIDTLDKQEERDLGIRLTLFAKIIDSDVVNYQRFIQIRNAEPNIMERYDYCYFTPDHLVVMFEEYDE